MLPDIIANHILNIAYTYQRSITNLQLHKVIFMAIGMSTRRLNHDSLMFIYLRDTYNKNDFEIWHYGVIIPHIYFKYYQYGDKPINKKIQGNDILMTLEGDYNIHFEYMDYFIKQLLDVDVPRLTALNLSMDHYTSIAEGTHEKYFHTLSFDELVNDFAK